MTRTQAVLLVALVGCALAAVTSQHKARKLFVELEKEQQAARQLEVEWGQLQLEQSTWATHARLERIARRELGMQAPPRSKVAVIAHGEGR